MIINNDGSSVGIDKILSNNQFGTRWYSEKELESALKLQEIFEQDLIDWKSSSEMKPECGHVMMTQPFVEKVYSVLKSMKEESENA